MKRKIACIIVSIFIVTLIGAFIISNKTKNPDYENQQNDVCFVIGNTRNVKQIDSNILEDEILQAMEKESKYSIIVIDGNPNEISVSGKLENSNRLFTKKDNNQETLNNRMKEITSCVPNDEEIDILAALDYASKSIDEKADNKKIVIYSSGISTAGELNFAKNPDLIYDDPNKIIEYLKNRHALPDLSNIEIVWYGINHVEGEQVELSTFELYKLKCIWSQILKECGVKFENISEIFNEKPSQQLSNEADKSDFPKVSVVKFNEIVFSIEEFEFEIDTAILKNRKGAVDILRPIAQDIINAGFPQFYIVGSTASDYGYSKAKCLELSLERAQAIKDILCDLGVPENCLKIYGLGREYIDGDNRWRINDLNSNDKLNHVLAQKNRKVMLIPSDSVSGKDFIEDYNEYFNCG